MLRESTKKKEAEELARALAAKPAAKDAVALDNNYVNPDYVPPPVVNIQAQLGDPRRRRPLQSELDQTPVIQSQAETVEQIKAQLAKDFTPGLPGATAEAVEAAHHEQVRQLKVSWAKAQANGKMPKYDVEDTRTREQRAHEENLEYVKAEMARTIHTEDYSG